MAAENDDGANISVGHSNGVVRENNSNNNTTHSTGTMLSNKSETSSNASGSVSRSKKPPHSLPQPQHQQQQHMGMVVPAAQATTAAATVAASLAASGGANGLLQVQQPANNNMGKHHQHPPPPPLLHHHSMDNPAHNFYHSPPDRRDMPPHLQHPRAGGGGGMEDEDADGLGPLPSKWEKAYTESGESYFIDHNTGTSHWLDPRLSKFQKKSLEDCQDDELPYGWEKIHDPQYGTYFIDHVNRRTQYENPVLEAKRRAERGREPPPPAHNPPPAPSGFTRNPIELCGERLTTTLLKSSRGLGFTIVGGDDNVDEFLQIKSIVPNGPAWLDGKLQTGDILVYVNDTCVLGFSHHEMVNVFQSIQPGETVTLEICRGYPLPFDPNDPNTEVVTTIAVDGLASDPDKIRILMDFNIDGNYNFLDTSDTNGAAGGPSNGIGQKNPLAKLTHQSNNSVKSDGSDNYANEAKQSLYGGIEPEILNLSIVKGAAMGFGFTIADSAYGQKVKKILDGNCCTKLVEGDYLLAINNINVKHMSHGEVVQVLKHCPKGQEAVLKIQRGQYFNGSLGGKGGKLRRSGDRFGTLPSAANGKDPKMGLFRSKTPTADLYSTQTKEILPVRPKTPLVDTRSRAKTPSSEHQEERINGQGGLDELDKNDDNKSADAKSNNSIADHDSINNDIPYMDPFPKMVTTLSDRLAEAQLNSPPVIDPHSLYSYPVKTRQIATSQPELSYDQQLAQDYYSNGGTGSNGSTNGYHVPHHGNNGIYSPSSPLPIMAPVPTYHHESCYCFECQDYGRHQQEYALQTQYQYANGPGSRNQKRINDYMIDRRKAGFSPLETHGAPMMHPQHPQLQQQQQHQMQMMQQQQKQMQQMQQQNPHHPFWKYGGAGGPVGQGSPGSGGMSQHSNMEEHSISEVTLERQQLGFGFRIVGGTEEGSQVTVGHIVPGGAADGDSRIATGDEILSIDGHNVVQGSHHRVVQLMGEAALRGQVTMILRRKMVIRSVPNNGHQSNLAVRYPYDVIVSRNENEGFGFVISSSQFYGSTIGKLIPGSPADRCEELKVDDRIIAVNRVDINGMSHGDVVNLIKESGLHVRLTIGNPKEAAMLDSSALPLQQQTLQLQHPQLHLQQQQQQQHMQNLQLHQMQQQQQHQQLQSHQQQLVHQNSKNDQFYDGYAMVATQSPHPQL